MFLQIEIVVDFFFKTSYRGEKSTVETGVVVDFFFSKRLTMVKNRQLKQGSRVLFRSKVF